LSPSHPQFFIAAILAGVFAIGLSGAGNNPAEEATIRKLITAADTTGGIAGTSLPDAIFWSGAYKKPMIGSIDKGQAGTDEGSISDRVPGSQKIKTEPIRIVVSDSHDLAYEYSKYTLEFTTKKSGKHYSFDGGVLRVWQKQGGQWKQAAMFARPYDE
jgi:ketosteroid isomerase-like protein